MTHTVAMMRSLHLLCPGTPAPPFFFFLRIRAPPKSTLFPYPTLFRSHANLDIVHILAPPPLHKAAALQCLEAGVDVFLEKPAAVNTAECEELRAAAVQFGRQIGVNRSEEHTSELQSHLNLVCRLLLEK